MLYGNQPPTVVKNPSLLAGILLEFDAKQFGANVNNEPALDKDAELKKCAKDFVYCCKVYFKTYDPRLAQPIIPFHLFPRQVEFAKWLDVRVKNQEGGLVEKSRDAGVTWLCAAYAVHKWLFGGPVAIGFGSRKLELVDKGGDLNSILEKCRFLIRNLPSWMKPEGLVEDDMAFCKIINRKTGASITGEGGDNMGRGGRSSVYFRDEAAFVERAHNSDAALSQNTNVLIDVSTPNGTGNSFYKKRFSGRVPVFTFHWLQDNRKNGWVLIDPETKEVIQRGNGHGAPVGARYPWYDKQCASLDPVIVAQEIDINYSASVEGVCIPAEWVKAAIELDLNVEESAPLVGGYDVAEEGANKNVLIARRGPRVVGIAQWSHLNTTQSAYRAADEAEKLNVKILRFDAPGVGAGIKATFESTERQFSFTSEAVNTGGSTTDRVWPDGQASKQKFINLRAEAWWDTRRRFEKTFEYVTHGVDHPHDELISIPNEPQLIAELSQPRYFHTDTGKIKIESKADMRRRGISSPDYADALILAFLPCNSMSIIWAWA